MPRWQKLCPSWSQWRQWRRWSLAGWRAWGCLGRPCWETAAGETNRKVRYFEFIGNLMEKIIATMSKQRLEITNSDDILTHRAEKRASLQAARLLWFIQHPIMMIFWPTGLKKLHLCKKHDCNNLISIQFWWYFDPHTELRKWNAHNNQQPILMIFWRSGLKKLHLYEQRSHPSRRWEVGWDSTASQLLRWAIQMVIAMVMIMLIRTSWHMCNMPQ